jgi:hypothetical protein
MVSLLNHLGFFTSFMCVCVCVCMCVRDCYYFTMLIWLTRFAMLVFFKVENQIT